MNKIVISSLLFMLASFGSASPKWITLGGTEGKGTEVKLLGDTEGESTLEVKLNGYYLEKIEIDGKPHSKIVVPSNQLTNQQTNYLTNTLERRYL